MPAEMLLLLVPATHNCGGSINVSIKKTSLRGYSQVISLRGYQGRAQYQPHLKTRLPKRLSLSILKSASHLFRFIISLGNEQRRQRPPKSLRMTAV